LPAPAAAAGFVTCVAIEEGMVFAFWPTRAFTLSSSTWLSKGLVT
jgi:hypothetical protein